MKHAQQRLWKCRKVEQNQEMPLTGFHSAHASSIVELNAVLTIYNLQISAPQPPTVVMNPLLPDGAGSNSSNFVCAKLPAVAHLVVAPLQTTMSTEVVAILTITARTTKIIIIAVLSVFAYMPLSRRSYVDRRLVHGSIMNVKNFQLNELYRGSATVVSTTIIEN